MDVDVPADLVAYLDELDEFIEIEPLEAADDNVRFFDHRPMTRVLERAGVPDAPTGGPPALGWSWPGNAVNVG